MNAQVAHKLMSFEEYLYYDDGTENLYELIDGELALMSRPTVRHMLIADFLLDLFKQEIKRLELPWKPFVEAGVRTAFRRSRYMDVGIVTLEQVAELMDRPAVYEEPPLLAVEIVSPESIKRDYRYKRSEYAVAEIPEYWIVDPLEEKVSVLLLDEGLYELTEYKAEEKLISTTFPELNITANTLLQK